MKLTAKLKQWVREKRGLAATFDCEKTFKLEAAKAIASGEMDGPTFAELTKDPSAGPTPDQMFGGSNGNGSSGGVRVKSAAERYSKSKEVGLHHRTGKPVTLPSGEQVKLASELEVATLAALIGFAGIKSGHISGPLPEHHRELLETQFRDEVQWIVGSGNEAKAIRGSQAKALINESGGSGGAALVPAWLDENIIMQAILFGELLPKVEIINVPYGSQVDAAFVNVPSFTWGSSDGTEAPLFDTTGMTESVGATVYDAISAVEISRNLLSDSLTDFGRRLNDGLSQQYAADVDEKIAIGDGTTAPEGVMNASGITDVPFGGDTAEVSDFETLLFTVPKAHRPQATRSRQVFAANETTYRRIRSTPISETDQRRVFGMDHESYLLLDHPFAIVPNMANNQVFFGNMTKYRLWRRGGLELRLESGGKELVRKNLLLLVARGRVAGRVVDPAAFALTDDAEA